MTTTLAVSGNVVLKAGLNASVLTEAQYEELINQAECQINADTEYNWNDNYAALNVDVKYILQLAASNLAAIYLLDYNPNAWTISTATFKLNVLWNGYYEAIKVLREKDKGQIFVREA